MQAGVVDSEVLNAGLHLHAAPRQRHAVRPAGGAPEVAADGFALALQQVDRAVRLGSLRLHAGDAAARMVLKVDAPLAGKGGAVQRRRGAGVRDQFGHVKADAACTHDRHPFADRRAAQNGVDVADDLGMVDALDVGPARRDAGGHHHLVKGHGFQQRRIDPGIQAQLNAQ